MNDKMKLMHKVWYSNLNASQKLLLTFLISKADDNGTAVITTAKLCQVVGMKHEKNFKGVAHYLPGLVTVSKQGTVNSYTLSVPSIEGLPIGEVVLKETERRGTTPSTAGSPVPSTEGSPVPSTAGTNRTLIEHERTKTASADASALPFDTKQEDEMYLIEALKDIEPPLDKEERETVRRRRKDRLPDEQIVRLLLDERTDPW